MMVRRGSTKNLLFCWLAMLSVAMELHAAPEIEKVEPPSWWAGHSINPVQVMIRGQGLAGAQVFIPSPSLPTGAGLHVVRVRSNPAGTYLFVDVMIDEQAKPRSYRFDITSTDGRQLV